MVGSEAADEVQVHVRAHKWDAASASAGGPGEPVSRTVVCGRSLVVSRRPLPHDPAFEADEFIVPDLGNIPSDEVPQEALRIEPIPGTRGELQVRVSCRTSHPDLWRLRVRQRLADGLRLAVSQGVPLLLENVNPGAARRRNHSVVELQHRQHRGVNRWSTLATAELFWDADPRLLTRRGAPITRAPREDDAARAIEARLKEYFARGAERGDDLTTVVAVAAVSSGPRGLDARVAEALLQVSGRAVSRNPWPGWRMVGELQRTIAPREYVDVEPDVDVDAYLRSAMQNLPDGQRSTDAAVQVARFLASRSLLPAELLHAAGTRFASWDVR